MALPAVLQRLLRYVHVELRVARSRGRADDYQNALALLHSLLAAGMIYLPLGDRYPKYHFTRQTLTHSACVTANGRPCPDSANMPEGRQSR